MLKRSLLALGILALAGPAEAGFLEELALAAEDRAIIG